MPEDATTDDRADPSGLPPDALERWPEIESTLAGRPIAVFLDYDGTLAEIAPTPDEAVIAPRMRALVERIAAAHPTTIVSGRSREDVRSHVGVEAAGYAGSHGFDIAGPHGGEPRLRLGYEHAPELAAAAARLREAASGICGAWVEEKDLAVALHYRHVAPGEHDTVRRAFDWVAGMHPSLRASAGKMVLELRPGVPWDKGRAALWVLERLGVSRMPVYVGDDLTDEDAFHTLRDLGVTVLVADHPRPTAARYSVRSVHAVGELLERVAG